MKQEQDVKGTWPSLLPSLFEEWDRNMAAFHESSGISISEDNKYVYVEAALPGITSEEVEIHYDKGILMIKADKKEEAEDKSRKYYRKAHRNFFYQVAVPGRIDENRLPEAICKNGFLKVTFFKINEEGQKKKIAVKQG